MSAEVVIPQFWQHLTGNVKEVEVKGETVGDCIGELVEKFPRLEDVMYDEKGNLPSLLNVYINKKAVYPEPMARHVQQGDKIYIAYTLVGG